MDTPGTRHARSGDVAIAYQAVGGGPVDLVFALFSATSARCELHDGEPAGIAVLFAVESV